MRVRLYWSIARLAHTQGREAVALENVRKAIALLQATDDTFHLARAHVLAAEIMLGRSDAGRCRAPPRAGGAALRRRPHAAGHARDHAASARVVALLRGNATAAIAFATRSARAVRRVAADGTGHLGACARRRARAHRRGDRGERGLQAGGRPARGRRASGAPHRPRLAPGAGCCGSRARSPRRSTCSTAQPSSACGRRPKACAPSVDGRARGQTPRPVLARVLGAPRRATQRARSATASSPPCSRSTGGRSSRAPGSRPTGR